MTDLHQRPFRTKYEPPTGLTPTQELATLSDDNERAKYCEAKAAECRNEWFDGQRDYVYQVVYSTDGRMARLSPEQREDTAKYMWGKSKDAQDLAGLEQMWTRWAVAYRLSALTGMHATMLETMVRATSGTGLESSSPSRALPAAEDPRQFLLLNRTTANPH